MLSEDEKLVGPTPEQQAKHEYSEVETLVPDDAGTERRGLANRNLTATLLDRYRHRDYLSRRQWEAGDKFRSDHFLSGLERNIIAGYDAVRVDAGDPAWQMPATMRQAAARRRLRQAINALGRRLAAILTGHVILEWSATAVGENEGRRGRQAEIAGMTAIGIALDSLADHYGLGR